MPEYDVNAASLPETPRTALWASTMDGYDDNRIRTAHYDSWATVGLSTTVERPAREDQEKDLLAAGVDVLYMLPLSNDTNAVIEEMHSFADRVKAAA